MIRSLPLLGAAALAACAASKQLARFAPEEAGRCGERPNCVSSLDPRPERGAAAWPYEGERAAAKARLEAALRSFPRSTLVASSEDYLHAEFRTRLWRFTDDVELYLPAGEKLVHFRSASRAGHYDFGANRRRLKAVERRFLAKDAP